LEVQVVLRKVTRNEVWESAFVGPASGNAALAVSSESRDEASTEAVALGLKEPEAPIVQEETSQAVAEVAVIEDSAELDVADPIVQDTAKVEGPSAPGTRSAVLPDATAAVVQSATVMGQSVLLRNKLMFQLL